MTRSQFTKEQIAYALRQVESGTSLADGCRAHSSLGHLTPNEFAAQRQTEMSPASLRIVVTTCR